MHTVINWIVGIGGLGAVVLAIFVANFLRDRFQGIKLNWEASIIPSIGFLLTHLTIWWMWPQYWTPFYESNGFTMLQIAAVFGFYGMSLSKKPAKVIGKGLVFLAMLGLVLNAWSVFKIVNPTLLAKETSANIAGNVPLAPPPPSPEGERRAREFWQKHDFSPEYVEEMVKICQLESYGCNQFEADGVTPLQSRTVDAHGMHGIGKYQISEYWYGEQARLLGYNIYTEQGNEDMALWIRMNYGAEEWNTFELARNVAREKEIMIEAPIEGWSYKKTIPVGGKFSLVPEGPVTIQLSDGRQIDADQDSHFDVGASKWLRFKSRTNEVVKVHFALTH